MTHPDDKHMTDTEMNNLSDWLQTQINKFTILKDGVDNSNTSCIRMSEVCYDKLEKLSFRPRCIYCDTSNNVKTMDIVSPICPRSTFCKSCQDKLEAIFGKAEK